MVLAPLQFSGRGLTPDVLGGIQQGQQVAQGQNILDQQQLGIEGTRQKQALAQQQAEQTAAAQQQAQGLLSRRRAGAPAGEIDAEVADLLFTQPDVVKSLRSEFKLDDDAKVLQAAKLGLNLELATGNRPKQDELLQQQIATVEARNGDASQSRQLLAMSDEQRLQAAKLLQAQAFSREELAKIAGKDIEQQRKPIDRTALEKNLVSAGLTPGTPAFQNAVKQILSKPTTSISLGADNTFKKEVSKGQAKTFGRVGEEADAAIDANQSLDVLESIDVDSGALEPAKQGIAAFATAFGIDSTALANISKGEAFNAEAQRIVLSVKASQKGPQTDKDEITIRKTVANLGNTKAGNQFIIDSARALNNRRIERKGFYDRFIEDADGKFKDASGKTADSAWSEFKSGTPMISSNLRTPEGLPVFFYKFESDVRNANPDASRAEIMEAWRAANKGAK